MKAFLTGSYVYGTPRPDSDIDLCVRVGTLATSRILRDLSESVKTVRFGRLNLILCESDTEYAAWKMTTERLMRIATETGQRFDKIAAHEEFEKDRAAVGIQYKGDSGQDYGPEDYVGKMPKRATNAMSDPFSDLV